MVFQFRAVSPNTTSGAQAALMTTWQSCDCYLPPVNGPFLCLTFFSYAFAPLFCSLFLFSRLLFYPCFFFFFFFFCLISYCLFFCSFLFIGKASLEPADYPRVFLCKKACRLAETRPAWYLHLLAQNFLTTEKEIRNADSYPL